MRNKKHLGEPLAKITEVDAGPWIVDGHWPLGEEVKGRGRSGLHLGDGTWPEENFLLVMYAERQTARKILKVIRTLKKEFPQTGMRLFRTRSRSLV